MRAEKETKSTKRNEKKRDIRGRLTVEEAHRQQVALIAQSADKDRLLRLFYDLPFVGLAVTSPTSKRWLQVNDRMCEMLGYSREEMMELAWTEITHPDDIPANLALFKRLAAGEFDSFQFDKRFLRKDGGVVDTTMECRCVRRRDGSVETVVIMVQDITERKQAEQALRDSAEQLRLFTDNVPAMTVSYDENLHCRFINRRYSDFFGFGAKEIVGKHLREIVGEEAYSEIKGNFAQVLQGHPVTYHRTHKRPNGESRHLEIKALPHIGEHGKVLGCFAVVADITEHKQTEERIQRIAHHDSLTGLPNRLLFNDRLDQAIGLARRGSRRFALLYIDLNKFKPVNDNLGHHVGDELLKSVAERIRHQVRESDTVARIGGDEFTVILPDITSRDDAETVAKKLAAVFATPFQLGRQKQSVDIGASIGIAVYPTDGQDADALTKAADAAMYSAKQAEKQLSFLRGVGTANSA
jgi:diguanylate cyclase (GGDEF)-like protein/PAS domain S-box-containing protein